MLNAIAIGLSLVALLLLVWQQQTPAQSPLNLQADIFELRNQVSQLRAEVAQLSQQGGNRWHPPAQSLPRSSSLTDRQMLDRLATLAIEAKDRLTALEARVSRLEQR